MIDSDNTSNNNKNTPKKVNVDMQKNCSNHLLQYDIK